MYRMRDSAEACPSGAIPMVPESFPPNKKTSMFLTTQSFDAL
jgi:hypothetical protein